MPQSQGKDKKDRAGATAKRQSLPTRFAIWRSQHRTQFGDSLHRLIAKPLANGVTLLLLTIAILLPCLLYMGVRNIEQWVSYSENGLEVSAYLHMDTQPRDIDQLRSEIRQWPTVKAVRYVSADEALTKLGQSIGAENIISSLASNPLPPTLLLSLHGLENLESDAQTVSNKLGQMQLVESVEYNIGWFRKAQALVGLGKRLAAALAGILGVGVLLVIGNTIRLAIESRSEEILVAKLVGATDNYVRRPFLYMGAWLGWMGAVLAIVLTGICLLALTYYIEPIEKAYNTQIPLSGLPLTLLLGVMLGCTLLGWLGALLISNSHLRRIEPR